MENYKQKKLRSKGKVNHWVASQSKPKSKRISYEDFAIEIWAKFKAKVAVEMGAKSVRQEIRTNRLEGSDERDKGESNSAGRIEVKIG